MKNISKIVLTFLIFLISIGSASSEIVETTYISFVDGNSYVISDGKMTTASLTFQQDKWYHPFDIYINPDRSGVGRDQTISAVTKGIEVWLPLTETKLINSIQTTNRSAGVQDGYSVISWEPLQLNYDRDIIVDGVKINNVMIKGLENTWSDKLTGEIYEADFRFNSLQPWGVLPSECSVGNPSPSCKFYDIQSTSTHEMGHIFGLPDFWESGSNLTMRSFALMGDTSKITLETGDIEMFKSLYPSSTVLQFQTISLGNNIKDIVMALLIISIIYIAKKEKYF